MAVHQPYELCDCEPGRPYECTAEEDARAEAEHYEQLYRSAVLDDCDWEDDADV